MSLAPVNKDWRHALRRHDDMPSESWLTTCPLRHVWNALRPTSSRPSQTNPRWHLIGQASSKARSLLSIQSWRQLRCHEWMQFNLTIGPCSSSSTLGHWQNAHNSTFGKGRRGASSPSSGAWIASGTTGASGFGASGAARSISLSTRNWNLQAWRMWYSWRSTDSTICFGMRGHCFGQFTWAFSLMNW